MKYTIRTYALDKGLTTLQIFNNAWNSRFRQSPNRRQISEDIHNYLNFGAVPPYVASYLEKKAKKPRWSLFTPYYART